VEVRLYGNRRLYADVMLFQGDTPLVVVEVEGNTQHLQAGYDEARLKGAAWNLENPVPLLWVAAGNHDALYQLQPSQSSIQYAPLDGETPAELLAPARLLEAIGDYLRRTETEEGQELRYRDALQRALAKSRGNSAHEKFRKWLFEQARPVAILGLPRGLFPHTPSRMYALMMVKSPRRKPKRCLITELRRHEISGNRAAVVRLIQGVLYA
jgi:hypothetical protein